MVRVKVYGVSRLDSGVKDFECEASSVKEVFDIFNSKSKMDEPVSFGDVIVFLNGSRTSKKSASLKNGDEVWIMSPASGG